MVIITIKLQYMKWRNYFDQRMIYFNTKSMFEIRLIINHKALLRTMGLVMRPIYFTCLIGLFHTIIKS